jgi:hypothetical protein
VHVDWANNLDRYANYTSVKALELQARDEILFDFWGRDFKHISKICTFETLQAGLGNIK